MLGTYRTGARCQNRRGGQTLFRNTHVVIERWF